MRYWALSKCNNEHSVLKSFHIWPHVFWKSLMSPRPAVIVSAVSDSPTVGSPNRHLKRRQRRFSFKTVKTQMREGRTHRDMLIGFNKVIKRLCDLSSAFGPFKVCVTFFICLLRRKHKVYGMNDKRGSRRREKLHHSWNLPGILQYGNPGW